MLLDGWRNLHMLNSTERLQVFKNLINARPDFFRNHLQKLNLPSARLSDLRKKNIIGPEQITQPILEVEEPKQIPQEDEEDVLASVKSMLKIAQKLDIKKEYRLADKLTYILRKKI
jgi:hypothetical protein